MRTINLTIKFEDSDMVEHSLRTALQGLLGDSIVDIKTLPNAEHLQDDENYIKMKKLKRKHEKELYRYIDSKR